MFEKLLSLLPYNPGLAGQMSNYARRMRTEASVRLAGFILLVLAFLVQFLAVISPPKAADADKSVYAGAGVSLIVGAAIVVLAGYFYVRARLLAKESRLALHANATAN